MVEIINSKENLDEGMVELANIFYREEGNKILTTLDEIKEQFDKYKNFKLFVIRQDGKTVSMAGISIFNVFFDRKPNAWISWVITNPDFRGKHYAQQIMEEAIKYAKEAGCGQVMLDSANNEKRIAAHKLYRKLGFEGDNNSFFEMYF